MYDKTVTPHDCNEEVSFPSLSSLIENIDEEFGRVSRVNVDKGIRWHAYPRLDVAEQKLTLESWPTEGKTPDEACAKLWLVLNK